MRIVSGKYKGMIVPIIKNATYRPTTGKLKEAIFSILSSGTIAELDGANVLDLFTGTGSLAFEALSRGANFVLGIDREANHIKACKEFATKLSEQDNINFLVSDATNLPNAQKQYDIIIIDPPYFHNMADKTIISLHNKGWLNHGAILMIEVGRKEDVKIPEYYTLLDERIYGNTKLIILRYEANLIEQ
jgi:16S rRNA (guanine966-N2)-methyltransferase